MEGFKEVDGGSRGEGLGIINGFISKLDFLYINIFLYFVFLW